jgi:hypothetical protein
MKKTNRDKKQTEPKKPRRELTAADLKWVVGATQTHNTDGGGG